LGFGKLTSNTSKFIVVSPTHDLYIEMGVLALLKRRCICMGSRGSSNRG
jgi:hypothetical protein